MSIDIKEKIQKMLELAKRGGTEAEAATAMRMVLQALAKHNLDMSDVENQEEQEEDVVQISVDGSRQAWQAIIWSSVSDFYFCRVFSRSYKLNGKNFKSFVLVGRQSNVETAKSVIAYLIDLAKDLAVGDTLYRNSFKLGYSYRIGERCKQEKEKATDLTLLEYASMAPAIINLYAVTTKENADFLAGLNLNLKARKMSPQPRDERGYLDGVEMGSKVSLKSSAIGRIE